MRTNRKLSEAHKQLISQSMKRYWSKIPNDAPIIENERQCLCRGRCKQEIEEG